MDDAFIKINTALLNTVSRPFPTNGNGGAQNKPKLASPPARCSLCGKPLIEFEFRDHFALTCDTVGCYLFRQTQECRAKNPRQEEKDRCYKWSSSYEDFKAQKRENYRLLRNLGIEPKEASLKSNSNKQTQLALGNGGQT
jgi:hypothetical protein